MKSEVNKLTLYFLTGLRVFFDIWCNPAYISYIHGFLGLEIQKLREINILQKLIILFIYVMQSKVIVPVVDIVPVTFEFELKKQALKVAQRLAPVVELLLQSSSVNTSNYRDFKPSFSNSVRQRKAGERILWITDDGVNFLMQFGEVI